MKKHMIRQERLSPGNTGCLVKAETEEEKEQEKDKGYYCVHTMSDVPEYKEILDQWFAAEKELAAYRDRCMKEGMKLFTRYLWELWD